MSYPWMMPLEPSIKRKIIFGSQPLSRVGLTLNSCFDNKLGWRKEKPIKSSCLNKKADKFSIKKKNDKPLFFGSLHYSTTCGGSPYLSVSAHKSQEIQPKFNKSAKFRQNVEGLSNFVLLAQEVTSQFWPVSALAAPVLLPIWYLIYIPLQSIIRARRALQVLAGSC